MNPLDSLSHVPDNSELGEGFSQFLRTTSDVPESSPSRTISIDEAGICHQDVFLQIRDIAGAETYKPVLCTVQISSSLSGHRGVHMSRFEEALFATAQAKHESIDAFALALARAVRDGQGSTGSTIRAEGIYLHEHPTSQSNRISHDKLFLLSDARLQGDTEHVRTGVRAFNMNACPCTRAHTKFSTIPELQKAGLTPDQIRDVLSIMLTGTHTQRGLVTVTMDKTVPEITSGNLYGIIDRSTHLVYELLKRPDEYALVTETISDSQYAEDVVRETAFRVYERFADAAPATTHVDVESLLQDSIHIHDVRSVISRTLGQIGEDISSGTQS